MLFLEILKLFLMCAMGFGIVKAGILKSSDSGPLSAIALYIVCPCVYLNAYQADYDPVQARSLLVTFIAAVIIVSACLIICTLLSRPLHLSDVEVTSAAYSNAGNMIIPIISSMLGEEWVFYTTALVTVQMFFFWTHMASVFSGKFDLKKILTNVNMISVFAAVLLYLFRIRIPATLLGALRSTGSMIGPLSMIITGMLLANASFDPSAASASAVHPDLQGQRYGRQPSDHDDRFPGFLVGGSVHGGPDGASLSPRRGICRRPERHDDDALYFHHAAHGRDLQLFSAGVSAVPWHLCAFLQRRGGGKSAAV